MRRNLEDACYIAVVVAGYGSNPNDYPWGKETISFIEKIESEILQRMKKLCDQHEI